MNEVYVKTATEGTAKAAGISARLGILYPAAECALRYEGDPWKLLVMARLSAQCTDKRVNEVSVALFEKYPGPEAMAEAPLEELEAAVRTCGLFRTKAASIRDISYDVVHKFGGHVPSGMNELLSMNGVGRKIANLVRGDVFGIDGIVTDTHCLRISRRLGLTDTDDPKKAEKQLLAVVPEGEGTDFCHRLVLFGREICKAQRPLCEQCPLREQCTYPDAPEKDG